MAGKKMPVSERALIKRVNRCLSESGRKLMKNHPARSKKLVRGGSRTGRRKLTKREIDFGTYFVVQLGDGGLDYENIVERHVDLEEISRRLGAISAFEFLEIEKMYGRE